MLKHQLQRAFLKYRFLFFVRTIQLTVEQTVCNNTDGFSPVGPSPTYPAVPTSAPGECPSLAWQKYESDCYLFMMRDTDYRTWHESVE